jgi:UDP-2,3-diacylglucosamine hydrolase|tara:strand:- start:33 stop:785 length:753 start_codon:yes stop_codon:yes gene_type:complete
MELPLYFISDLHLRLDPSDEEIQRQKRLFHFFRHIAKTKGTLFIVGDLFDFYFEYKDVIPKDYFQFYMEINRLKESGVNTHFILGNHDFWVMDFMKTTLMHKVHDVDLEFTVNEKNFLLTHGDGLLSWDWGYRILKKIIRSRLFVWCYRWLHPNLGYWIAKKISGDRKHYIHSDEYNDKVLNDLEVFAQDKIENGVDYILCGHYHQASEKLISSGKLLILGDWFTFDSYAVFDGENLVLKRWDFNNDSPR